MKVTDVWGNESEPICTYYRCKHKFSEHGYSSLPMQTSTEHSYRRNWFAGNAILKSMIPADGYGGMHEV